MKKILIVGGGYADIPLILSAKKLGFYVITTGNRPTDLGHSYSDEYHMVDFSDCEAILKLVKDLDVSAICPCCNDFSALSSAYSAEKLGLPGHDFYHNSQIIHHKDRFREFTRNNNIPTPRAIRYNHSKDNYKNIDSLSFPVIVKPVDLTGGKGISVANNIDEIPRSIKKALSVSRTNRVVVEEFIVGSRHGFSAFLYKGKVAFYFSDNEHYYLNPYMVSAASSPSVVPKSITDQLCKESEKIASLLSLKDGIFHVQYILKKGVPYIIEICRRAPGDLYIIFVKLATGVDYPSWIVKSSAGIDCGDLTHSNTKGFITRHCIMSTMPGKVDDIVFHGSIKKNIIEEWMWWKRGDIITDELTCKLGIVFLRFDSMDEMITKTELLNKLIQVKVGKM